MNKYASNSSKECVLEVDLEHLKQLRKLHNDYSLAPDKKEFKRAMLSDYQLKIAHFYNVPTGNVKKLVSNFFDEDKYLLHYELTASFETRIKTKKNTSCIRIQSIAMVKTIY